MTRGVGTQQRADAAGCLQGPSGIEPAWDPLPFLKVAEERTAGGERTVLGGGGQRISEHTTGGGALDVVADPHPVHRGHPGRARRPRPLGGLGDLRLLGGQPSTHTGEILTVGHADIATERGSVEPPAGHLRPRLRHIRPPLSTQFTQQRLVSCDRWLAPPQRRQRPLQRVQITGRPPGGTHRLTQALQQRRVHIRQQRTAVEEHRVRDQGPHRAVARRVQAVAPAAQQAVDDFHLHVHQLRAEDRAGQPQPLEAEEQGFIHGHAQEVGVGQQTRAACPRHLYRPLTAPFLRIKPDQTRPRGRVPTPPC